MIRIIITNTPITQKIEIQGHSDKGKEPCARVTSAFEMVANLLFKDRDELEQQNGYSLLVTTITDENKEQLKMAQAYFNHLKVHYQKTIQIENKEVQYYE